MKKLYSNADDCLKLANVLKEKMRKKIKFCGSEHNKVVCGKYFSHFENSYNDIDHLFEEGLPFYFMYSKDDFLRIEVGSYPPFENSLGEKLAALSSFYEILSKHFGEPSAFYVLNDEENTLALHWIFTKKEEKISDIKDGSKIGEIKDLIILGEKNEENKGYQLNEQTRKNNARIFNLPIELVSLACDNIEDFSKYKNGKEIDIKDDARIDCMPVTSLRKTFPN